MYFPKLYSDRFENIAALAKKNWRRFSCECHQMLALIDHRITFQCVCTAYYVWSCLLHKYVYIQPEVGQWMRGGCPHTKLQNFLRGYIMCQVFARAHAECARPVLCDNIYVVRLDGGLQTKICNKIICTYKKKVTISVYHIYCDPFNAIKRFLFAKHIRWNFHRQTRYHRARLYMRCFLCVDACRPLPLRTQMLWTDYISSMDSWLAGNHVFLSIHSCAVRFCAMKQQNMCGHSRHHYRVLNAGLQEMAIRVWKLNQLFCVQYLLFRLA